jgi:hypothetical protein
MRPLFKTLMLTAALAFFGLSISHPAQYGKDSPQKEEKEAALALTRLGIPLQRDPRGVVRWIEAPSGEFNDEALRYLPSLPKLEWLEVGGGSATSSGIANLKNCPAIRRLYVHDIDLGGDSFEWLAGLKDLEALSLQRTKVDGNVLKNLKSPNLIVLNLSGNLITDADMDQIASLKRLEVLALADTKISGDGIAKLEGMPRLNELNVTNCDINDRDLERFLTMPNLRIVYAAGCSISDFGIQSVVARFSMLAIFR